MQKYLKSVNRKAENIRKLCVDFTFLVPKWTLSFNLFSHGAVEVHLLLKMEPKYSTIGKISQFIEEETKVNIFQPQRNVNPKICVGPEVLRLRTPRAVIRQGVLQAIPCKESLRKPTRPVCLTVVLKSVPLEATETCISRTVNWRLGPRSWPQCFESAEENHKAFSTLFSFPSQKFHGEC